MAKKLSASELKQQGEELSKQISDLRKKEHYFAMVLGSDSIAFMVDRKKKPDLLWRKARQDSGGSKGAKGIAKANGKVLELVCDSPDSVPRALVKQARKFFQERGQPLQVVFLDPVVDARTAQHEQEPELDVTVKKPPETGPEAVPDGARTADADPVSPSARQEQSSQTKSSAIPKLKSAFKALKTPLAEALRAGGSPAKACSLAAKEFVAAIKAGDETKAIKVFAKLRKALSAAEMASRITTDKNEEKRSLIAELTGFKSELRPVLAAGSPLAKLAKAKLDEFKKAAKNGDLEEMENAFSTLRLAMNKPSKPSGDSADRVRHVTARIDALKAKIAALTVAVRDANPGSLHS